MLVLKRTCFGLACVLAFSLLCTPRAHAAGTDNAARAAIVVHPETGAVLYEKNADERMYPASTTKILTVWLALMMGDSLPEGIETRFPVSANATNLAPDESSAKFAIGEEVRLIDLCNAAILVSGNDAATAVAIIVGGSILMIAHPWNAELYSTKATKPADTSMAGYPGEVSSLRGQDSQGSSGSDAQDGRSGDEYSYDQLTDMYNQLGDIEEKLEQSQSDLEEVGLSGDQDERDAKAEEQKAIANDLSNLIADIGETDVSSGTYADTVKNLGTLGSWLRNWSDSLTEAWSRSTASADPSSEKDYILSPVSTGEGESQKNSYQQLFDTNYKDWEPKAPQS